MDPSDNSYNPFVNYRPPEQINKAALNAFLDSKSNGELAGRKVTKRLVLEKTKDGTVNLAFKNIDQASLKDKILARLGLGNWAFKNVMQFCKAKNLLSNLDNTQQSTLSRILTTYNATHATFKKSEIPFNPIPPVSWDQCTITEHLYANENDTTPIGHKVELPLNSDKQHYGNFFVCQNDITGTINELRATIPEGKKYAAVNAANPTLFYGGSGTNSAFAKLIEKEEWNQHKKNSPNKLNDGDCVAWNLTKSSTKNNTRSVDMVLHALGPKVNDLSDLETQQQVVYQAYKNIFKTARENNVDTLQMPLLSTKAYAKIHLNFLTGAKDKWMNMVNEAAYKAIQEEIEDPEGVKNIILVDKEQIPWDLELDDAKDTAYQRIDLDNVVDLNKQEVDDFFESIPLNDNEDNQV